MDQRKNTGEAVEMFQAHLGKPHDIFLLRLADFNAVFRFVYLLIYIHSSQIDRPLDLAR